MKSDNAIIIALIVIIIIVAGVYFFISGNGITLNPQNQLEEPATNISNSTSVVTTDNQPTDSGSSGGSNYGPVLHQTMVLKVVAVTVQVPIQVVHQTQVAQVPVQAVHQTQVVQVLQVQLHRQDNPKELMIQQTLIRTII